ncbi:hypothetical protein DQ04_12051010 [Trypanosoma grayi]|uniref:hypothetical protein n=1 Tax=Trypanosoma grayi TaxID=71804 RepID=UPI0004F4899B|nr:hypothetical protein DQ04_12051010 [Trypanosoma grayi]KEG06823.1 hypothetical protein DQ04_12051010 [Trypanosoma grayi]
MDSFNWTKNNTKIVRTASNPDGFDRKHGEHRLTHVACSWGAGRASLALPFFPLKMVRRRLFRLNRGFAHPTDPARLPLHALQLAQKWLGSLVGNGPVRPPRTVPTPATLFTNASLYGWSALLFADSG